jgi:hypothetical protein
MILGHIFINQHKMDEYEHLTTTNNMKPREIHPNQIGLSMKGQTYHALMIGRGEKNVSRRGRGIEAINTLFGMGQ